MPLSITATVQGMFREWIEKAPLSNNSMYNAEIKKNKKTKQKGHLRK